MSAIDFLPSQGVEQGAEPLLYAATSLEAVAGGYYGPADGSAWSTPRRPCTRPGGR
jgi:hypothetical protein